MVITSPVTPTWSPRSTSCRQRARTSGPTTCGVDHHLQVAAAVAQGGEAEPAHVALEHHPAGHRDPRAGRRCPGRASPACGADLGQRVGARVGRPGRGRCPGPAAGRPSPGVPASARAAASAASASATASARRRDQRQHRGGVLRVGAAPACRPSSAPERRRSLGERRAGQEALGVAGGGADPGQVGGVLEADEARLPGRLVLRVGAVERLELPVAAGQQQRLPPQPGDRPGADLGAALERLAEHREVQRDPARRRRSPARSASAATISSTSPLSAVGSRRIRSSDSPLRPHGTKLRKPRSAPSRVARLDQDAVAVERVLEPAERHREAALVAAVAAPLARRRRPARRSRRRQRRVPSDDAWCSRGAAAGRPTAAPASCPGPLSEKPRRSRIASSPISKAFSPASAYAAAPACAGAHHGQRPARWPRAWSRQRVDRGGPAPRGRRPGCRWPG